MSRDEDEQLHLPAWLEAKGKKEQNRRSKKQEEDWAKKTGGKRQAGSGSSSYQPQDVKNSEYMDQLKYTDALAFRLRILEWMKLKDDAMRFGREPRMVIEFPLHKIKLMITEIHDD